MSLLLPGMIDWEAPPTDDPLNRGLRAWFVAGGPWWGRPVWRQVGGGPGAGTLTSFDSSTSGWRGAAGRPGGHGGSLVFDGSNDHLLFGDSALYEFASGQGFTFSFWFHGTAAASQGGLLSKGYESETPAYPFYLMRWNAGNSSGALDLFLRNAAFDTWITTATGLGGAWQHVSASYDAAAATSQIYVNGVANGAAATSVGAEAWGTNTDPFGVGRHAATYLNAGSRLDSLRVQARGLSAAEAMRLYHEERRSCPSLLPRRRPRAWFVPADTPTAYTLTAEPCGVVIAPQDAGLLYGRTLAAESCAVVIACQDASLLHGRLLAAEPCAVVIATQDVSLLYGRLLAAEACDVAIAPQDVSLLYGRLLTAEPCAVVIACQDAGLLYGRTLTAEACAVVIAPQDVTLLAARLLSAEACAVVISPQDVTLSWSGAGTYVLTAEPCAVVIAPQDAGLLYGRLLTAEPCAVVIACQDVSLLAARLLAAEACAVVISPQDAGLLYGRTLTAEPCAVVLACQDVSFLRTYVLAAEACAVVLACQDATLTWSGETVQADARVVFRVDFLDPAYRVDFYGEE